MIRCIAFVCLLAGVSAAQTKPLSRTEQVESGFLPASAPVALGSAPHSGPAPAPQRFYRIRLLPVSSFPQVPPAVASQLDGMGCMIPQTYAAHEPENVVHGAFEKKGSDDWAALCSIKGVSTLYVFFQSDLGNPILLRHQPDVDWLGREWAQDYGSAWGIATRRTQFIPNNRAADHDGIEDAYVEKSSTVHYYDRGRWTTIDGSQ